MIKKTAEQISIDQEYIPHKKSHHSKQKRRKTKVLLDNECNSNKWTCLENQRFLEFIRNNKELLLCQYRRKEEKVFLQLSKEVKTRSADQCRSHHQKMIKHHDDLDGIIRHLEKKLPPLYQQPLQKDENSQCSSTSAIKQGEQILKCCFETAVEIEVYEAKQRPKQEDDIWGLLDHDVWVNGQMLFSKINY